MSQMSRAKRHKQSMVEGGAGGTSLISLWGLLVATVNCRKRFEKWPGQVCEPQKWQVKQWREQRTMEEETVSGWWCSSHCNYGCPSKLLPGVFLLVPTELKGSSTATISRTWKGFGGKPKKWLKNWRSYRFSGCLLSAPWALPCKTVK